MPKKIDFRTMAYIKLLTLIIKLFFRDLTIIFTYTFYVIAREISLLSH